MTETDDDVLTLSGLQKVIYDCISKNRENNSSDTQSLISLASLKNKKGKIKLENFLNCKDKVLLNIATYEQFTTIADILDGLGITTNSGRKFSDIKDDIWRRFEHLTVLSPDRKFAGGVESAKLLGGYKVIKFEDLDLSGYFTSEESEKIQDTKSQELDENNDIQVGSGANTNTNYIMTVDEFWDKSGSRKKAIWCRDNWECSVINYVFDKMDKKYNGYVNYSNLTNLNTTVDRCYLNDETILENVNNKLDELTSWLDIIDFCNIDFGKYLSEDLKRLVDKLNFKSNNSTDIGVDYEKEQLTKALPWYYNSSDMTIEEFLNLKQEKYVSFDISVEKRTFLSALAEYCDRNDIVDKKLKNLMTSKKYEDDRYSVSNCFNEEYYGELHNRDIYPISFNKFNVLPYLTYDHIKRFYKECGVDIWVGKKKIVLPKKSRKSLYKAIKDNDIVNVREKWQADALRNVLLFRYADYWKDRNIDNNMFLDSDRNTWPYGPYTCFNLSDGSIVDIRNMLCDITDFENLDVIDYLTYDELKNLDQEKVLSNQSVDGDKENNEIPKVQLNKPSYYLTIDDFWDAHEKGEIFSIHTDQEWKANILTNVFRRMGKYWVNGDSYKDMKYERYYEKTCYSNYCCVGELDGWLGTGKRVFKFENIDLSKYLLPNEIDEIKEKLGVDPMAIVTKDMQMGV